jgi:hypothetical protein
VTNLHRRVLLLAGLATALIGAAAGCSGDGRELQPARPDQTQSILDPTTIPSTTNPTPTPFPAISVAP